MLCRLVVIALHTCHLVLYVAVVHAIELAWDSLCVCRVIQEGGSGHIPQHFLIGVDAYA